MELRLAKPQETIEIRNLWNYCFDDSPDFVEWFFNVRYEPLNTLVVAKDQRICSALQILPYDIALRDKKMATSYIVGVSTQPEDRGKGYVSELLIRSLETMRNRGQWISILLPFNYGFYRKYGWETCYCYNEYTGDRNSFSKLLGNVDLSGKILPIKLPRDLSHLTSCYTSYVKSLNGYVIRDQKDWERILWDIKIDGGNGYIYVRNDETIGSILLVKDKGELSIRALYSTDILSYKELLFFAVNYDPTINRIVWSDRRGEPPIPHMTESGIDKNEKPYVMGRIVDVQKAFDNITLAREIDLVIEVLDPLLEWNNNRFSFAYKNDGLSVLTTSNPPDFEIPISTLTQLLWGYYTPWQAMQHGLIKTFNREKIEDLDILFPKTTPYIYEDY